jgi:dolichol-phosphate mannosyltransferase
MVDTGLIYLRRAWMLGRQQWRKEAERFIKYTIVGVSGTVVDFGILNILIFLYGWTTEVGILMASVIAFCAAIINNFIWHTLWTFPEARNRNKRVQFVRFTVVSMVGLVLNTTIFYLSNRFLYSPLLAHALSVQLAKATASALVLFWNFGANRLWTYRGLSVKS